MSARRRFPPELETEEIARIVEFTPAHSEAFRSLNLEWISEVFGLEELDRRQLSDPGREIIDRGGEIFIAEVGDQTVGTCAMLFVESGHYELAKMAVAEKFRGRGIGQRLLDAAVRWARRKNAHEITLLSHSRLSAAVGLYEKNGFEPIPFDPGAAGYERCDIAMRLALEGD